MRSYDALSEVYALFADDFDYPKWAQYYRALLRRAGVEAQSVVDAGCGAGLMSAELAREGASRYLRIYIDKPDGITLSDCETYHRAVAPLVERVDYDFLEVCSPGLDRPLKKQKDFDKHAGEMVEIHLFRPVERRKQFEGELVGLVDGEIVIRDGENELRFAQKDVSLCKPLVIITEEDIAMDEEMSDDEKNDSEGR